MSCLQPHGIEVVADDIFLKQMVLDRAGTMVPQHTHAYDHLSMLATGRVRLWRDGELDGDFAAPQAIMIKAGVAHTFLALEDGTQIFCIHSLHGGHEVAVRKENTIASAMAPGVF